MIGALLASLLGVAGGAALEAAAVWTFALSPRDPAAPLFHVSASALFAVGTIFLLRRRFSAGRRAGFLFVFLLAFFIPVLGIVGFSLLVVPAVFFPREIASDPYSATAIPDLPLRPLFRAADATLRSADGALAGVLRHAADPEKRVSAVMALRHMEDRAAIPLLRIALKDPVDDVRLLAYAMLDSKDRRINRRIQDRSATLERTPKERRFFIHRYLAQDYWELAYLGIAQGEVLDFVLAKAREHLETALALQEEAGVFYMLGRVRMRQGSPEAAREAFERALSAGLPAATVLPYLAEVAFLERRFAEVKRRLAALGREHRARPPMAAVARYWLGS